MSNESGEDCGRRLSQGAVTHLRAVLGVDRAELVESAIITMAELVNDLESGNEARATRARAQIASGVYARQVAALGAFEEYLYAVWGELSELVTTVNESAQRSAADQAASR